MILEDIAGLARQAVAQCFGHEGVDVTVELPQDPQHGDLTINAFHLARHLRLPPPKIAQELAPRLADRAPIAAAEAVKGFVNLWLDPATRQRAALEPILAEPAAYGRGRRFGERRIMVEFSAPNTNKPLHLGHMRNHFLGDAVARLVENAGADVVRANLLNDRGIHICKSMVAYRHWGAGATPQSSGTKGDHLVGRFYVLFEKRFAEERDRWIADHPEHFSEWRKRHGKTRKGKPIPEDRLEQNYRAHFREAGFGLIPLGAECQETLIGWERGDTEVRELWETMNRWAIEGFQATYAAQGIHFDRVWRESETWALGRDIVLEGLEAGIFQRREDGAVEIDLEDAGLGRKILLRSDGTSIYITQDIGATVMKAESCRVDGQVWIVAEEQRYHFQVLFEILRRLQKPWATDLHHLAYGLVHLPEGRMKSREGKVVDADDLYREVTELAAAEVRSRDPEGRIAPEEVQRRAEVIGLSALRFMLLKVSPSTSMTFYPEESVKFEGDTGARILYAYARLATMLRDASERGILAEDFDPGLLEHETERILALDLLAFPRVCDRAALDHNPSLIAGWLIDLVRDLNRFYDQCDVLRAADPALRGARLALCRAAAAALGRGCDLLGMPVLERM
jgi:arginyl-tRNA synthetase